MMKKRNPVKALVFTAALALFAQTAWAERVILRNSDARVTVDDTFRCNSRTANIRIESTSPEIFESQSQRMQTLVDSTQAIIRYECPTVNNLQVAGYMLGLRNPVYSGVASNQNYWKIDTEKFISNQEVKQASETIESNPEEYADVFDTERKIAIATINLDMTVEEVARRVSDVFGSEPGYEPVTGIMNLELGGCPSDYYSSTKYQAPNEKWNCVKAWFTDRRIAKLYRLGYTQVSISDMNTVKKALVEHFGEPIVDKRVKKQHQLVWQAEGRDMADRAVIEQLEAKIRKAGNLVIIDLFLEDPELVTQYVNENDPDVKTSKLKL